MPVAGVRDLPPRPVSSDKFNGGQCLFHWVLIDPDIGLIQPALLLQMCFQIIQKGPEVCLKLIRARRPRLCNVISGSTINITKPVIARNGSINRYGLIYPNAHCELNILIEYAVIEFPGAIFLLNGFDHPSFYRI